LNAEGDEGGDIDGADRTQEVRDGCGSMHNFRLR
jgi:hypothetical protein